MNTLTTFFASIIALFSGLLGHSSPSVTIQQPVTKVANITEVSTSTIIKKEANSTSADISNLRVYQNNKYRFLIKHPSTVTVNEIKMQDSSDIVFYLELKHKGGTFDSTSNILIKKNKNNSELKKYVLGIYSDQCAHSQDSPEGEPCLTPPELIDFHFNNVQGFREKFSETNYGDYYFTQKSSSTLIYIYQESSVQPYDEKIFKEIISTIEFIQ